jgi:hypothetical protein
MKVVTSWPALVEPIRRAGHEPVIVPSECETCFRRARCVDRDTLRAFNGGAPHGLCGFWLDERNPPHE